VEARKFPVFRLLAIEIQLGYTETYGEFLIFPNLVISIYKISM
jgi:hypothetical protein